MGNRLHQERRAPGRLLLGPGPALGTARLCDGTSGTRPAAHLSERALFPRLRRAGTRRADARRVAGGSRGIGTRLETLSVCTDGRARAADERVGARLLAAVRQSGERP